MKTRATKPPTRPTNGAPNLRPLPDPLPSLKHLITEDGAPVDNAFVEKQYRLLTESLTNYWSGPSSGWPFFVCSDVGLFFEPKNPAVSPDIMLAVGARWGDDLQLKENRSYFVWLRGKVPDALIEIVSNRRGGEETRKFKLFQSQGVPYYIIFDPLDRLHHGVLRVFELRNGKYKRMKPPFWFPDIELGLQLWHGEYEEHVEDWLRWCYEDGQVVPVGKERERQHQMELERKQQQVQEEKQRGAAAQEQAARLRAQLWELGIDPDA